LAVDQEKRKSERVCAALPVALDGMEGITRDVSATGVFVQMDMSCAVGSLVRFTVEFTTPTRKLILDCEGDVVRTERRGTELGLAVRITDSALRLA
jgi:hypothetical protein